MNKSKYLLLTAFTLPSLLLANSIPNSSDATKSIKIPKELSKTKSKPLVELDGVKKQYKPRLKDDKSGRRVLIKSFIFTKNQNISDSILSTTLDTYKNKKLSFIEIQILSSLITKKYRDAGFLVAKAYIPEQTLSNGVLEIAIIEGQYGNFELINKSKVNSSLIQSIINHSTENKVIRNTSLDRSLLLLNDIPGIIITKTAIKAGEKIGTSDFNVIVEDTKTFDGYILTDNYGSRYTGKQRAMIGANLNSPFNIGDKLSITGLIGKGEDITNGSISYSFPMYSNGLRGKVAYSNTSYHLIEEYQNLDSVGETNTYNFTMTYPIVKTRNETLNIYSIVEQNRLKDEVRSTNYEIKKSSQVLRVGLNYINNNQTLLGMNQNINASIKYSFGNLKFNDKSQESLDIDGANTQGKYSKIELELSSVLQVNKQISLESSIKAQRVLNGKNLDGSEDFSIGGAYGVKTYPSGELSAENGYLFNIEAKYQLPNISRVTHNMGLFYDMGYVDMENPISTFKRRILKDIGIGHYANYKNIFTKFQVAWKIDNEHIKSEPDQNSKILGMIGMTF